MNTKTSAKDFFLQLGAIVAFYASTIALITLLFEVINFAYPKVTNYYQYYFPSISMQVAVLIVAFPLFLFLSWLIQKSFLTQPELREAPLRKWLSLLTLFIAGAVVAGDLVTVIYMFLDGQELTAGFLLKVLVLLVVAGGVFLYYLREVRNLISSSERNLWRIIALVIILGSIILGFMVIGSPKAQRERRYDSQRISDLQSIQWQLVNYFQQKKGLPDSLAELEDPISGFKAPVDPETGEPYEYKLIGQSAKAFELCATFNQANTKRSVGMIEDSFGQPMLYNPSTISRPGDNWDHQAGRTCFTRNIDPELYPVKPTNR